MIFGVCSYVNYLKLNCCQFIMANSFSSSGTLVHRMKVRWKNGVKAINDACVPFVDGKEKVISQLK